MKVIYGVGNLKEKFHNVFLAIGVFDGLHIGHQKLIGKTVQEAIKKKGVALVMTFFPHPAHVLRPEKSLPYIISLAHRIQLIEKLGVAACIVVRFTKRFSKMTAPQFIRRYLVNKIGVKEIFVGDDFRFGHDRQGTIDIFQQEAKRFGFKLNAVSTIKEGSSQKVGSSAVREFISSGQLAKAKKCLGRHVSILGKVVKGDGRGKKLGYRTANLHLKNIVIPPIAVYAVLVNVDGKTYQGMANIGRRPSFETSHETNLEVHIFQFHKNIYGRLIEVSFIEKIRDEKHFPSKETLMAQLRTDALTAKSVLSRIK